MDRILVNTPSTAFATFYVGAEATDPTPDEATVTITRDDGTVLAANAPAQNVGPGVFGYQFNTAQTALLDILTLRWTSTLGVITTTVEIVGGFLFSVAQALQTSGLSNKTPAQIIEARTLVETALEDACGVAFVPRYGKRFLSGNGQTSYLLPPRVTAIRSLKVDGVAAPVDDMLVLPTGEVYYPTGFTRGFSNYEIAFEHGYPFPPPRVSAAALLWAKTILVQGPMDDRALTYSTEDASYTMAVPGMRGSESGIPEVDQTIARYNLNVAVA